MTGRIHSFQSLGTLDGPGVRFVVFLQGCPLRCGCCHNPDTWQMTGGMELTATAVLEKAIRYREYFAKNGGITVSGGEPLLQTAFVCELFTLAKEAGIHTCLDTSGCILQDKAFKTLAQVTDRVLLDMKYTSDELYRKHVGCGIATPLAFLDALDAANIPTTLRQVIIPTCNDNADNIRALAAIRDAHACVDTVELLPFRKMCKVKYDNMGIPFPMADLPEPTAEKMRELQALL